MNTTNKSLGFRNEYKYLIRGSDHLLLENRLKGLLSIDPHAGEDGYMVNSLYFDDVYNSGQLSREDGIYERDKYRLRYYNEDYPHIKMETKKNRASYIHKRAEPLPYEDAVAIIEGRLGFNLKPITPVTTRYDYQLTNKQLKPKVIVRYHRLPFVFEPLKVRITLDSQISYSKDIEGFLDTQIPTESLLTGLTILEIKFNESLPPFISRLITTGSYEAMSLSKYSLACEAMDHKNNLLYRGGF